MSADDLHKKLFALNKTDTRSFSSLFSALFFILLTSLSLHLRISQLTHIQLLVTHRIFVRLFLLCVLARFDSMPMIFLHFLNCISLISTHFTANLVSVIYLIDVQHLSSTLLCFCDHSISFLTRRNVENGFNFLKVDNFALT